MAVTLMSAMSCAKAEKQVPIVIGDVFSLAESGDAREQFLLGEKYLNGNGLPKDYERAAKWLQMAADQGNPDAIYTIGIMMQNGWGFEKNLRASAKMFARAAGASHAKAQYQLSIIYFGINEYKASFDWAQAAANQGEAGAMFVLGLLFLETGDTQIAVKWLNSAASLGNQPAQDMLKNFGDIPKDTLSSPMDFSNDMLLNPFN